MKPPLSQGRPDDFQSPKEAILPLLPYLNKEWTIWECASGKGNLSKALRERGFIVKDTDVLDGLDFLGNTDGIYFDCIITNPPYSLKEKFLEKCYKLGKPFALLMPLTALESEKRQKMFRKYGINLLIPNKRYNFETPSGKGSGSWFATAWFCHGLNIPNNLNFVDLTLFTQPTKQQDSTKTNEVGV